jgi:hypothetical protein
MTVERFALCKGRPVFVRWANLHPLDVWQTSRGREWVDEIDSAGCERASLCATAIHRYRRVATLALCRAAHCSLRRMRNAVNAVAVKPIATITPRAGTSKRRPNQPFWTARTR